LKNLNAAGAEIAEKRYPKEKTLCGLCALCVEVFRMRIFQAISRDSLIKWDLLIAD
jgi:hypothetical protein